MTFPMNPIITDYSNYPIRGNQNCFAFSLVINRCFIKVVYEITLDGNLLAYQSASR